MTASGTNEAPAAESIAIHTAEAAPFSTLLRLAIPTLAEQVLVFLVGLVDVWLSGRISAEATKVVGVSAYLGWLALLLFGLVGTGATALVSRAWGAGRFEDARSLASRSAFLALPVGGVVCLMMQFIAAPAVAFLGLSESTAAVAVPYLRLESVGQFFAAFTLVCSASLRGAGDMRTPLFVLAVTNVVNVVVSSALSSEWFVPSDWRVYGIVGGTVVAQCCGAAVMACTLFTRTSGLYLHWSEFGWDRPAARSLLRIGGPAALEGLCTFAGHFLFLKVITLIPQPATLAAHTVGVRLEAISYLPAVACGIAAANLVGQSLGAGKPRLGMHLAHLACGLMLAYGTLTMLLFWFAAPALYAFMHQDAAVGEAGVPALRLMALYQIFNAAMIVYNYSLRGAGDTGFSVKVAIASTLGLRVPIAYLCAVWLGGGLPGAWLGMGADNLLRAVLFTWRFVSGRWIRHLP